MQYPYAVPAALAAAPPASILVAEAVRDGCAVHVMQPEMFDGRRMVLLSSGSAEVRVVFCRVLQTRNSGLACCRHRERLSG
jgi:hypothetical protein